VALITFGSLYTLVPSLWNRTRMYSARLVEVHFWLALSGTLIYVFAMWNSGIIQGLMWRTYNDSGTLAYSFIDSLVKMHPYYIARAAGGLLFLIGAVVCAYNIAMTIRLARLQARADNSDTDVPVTRPAGAALQAGE
jgi:cytochrome c oxidase cbb3-type subunit 1